MISLFKNIYKSIFAGASIALGSILFILCSSFVNEGKTIGAFLFPIGLILVCFLSFNLFTGKIGFFFNTDNKKKNAINLLIMLLFNIGISFFIGWIFNLIIKNNSQITSTLSSLYEKKTQNSYFFQLASSFMCGIFVYSAVILYKKMNNVVLKLLGIFLSISLFVLMGFDHCIANSFYFAAAGQLNNSATYLSLFISIIGNSFGAITINYFLNK